MENRTLFREFPIYRIKSRVRYMHTVATVAQCLPHRRLPHTYLFEEVSPSEDPTRAEGTLWSPSRPSIPHITGAPEIRDPSILQRFVHLLGHKSLRVAPHSMWSRRDSKTSINIRGYYGVSRWSIALTACKISSTAATRVQCCTGIFQLDQRTMRSEDGG